MTLLSSAAEVFVGKFLLLIGIAAVLWWLWRSRARSVDAGPPPAAPPQSMIQCAHCGVYLPASESVGDEQHRYCSEAHRSSGPQQAE